MASTCEILLLRDSVTIWESCKSFLNDVLNIKFGCVANSIASEGSQPMAQMKTPALVPEKRFEVLVSKVKVSVHKADLSNFRVDAVVNAANERLQHHGGIALALANAGGPQIQRDSDIYVSNMGHLKTGEAVAMNPGLLPCKRIIHAVGPQLTGQSLSSFPQAEKLLKNAVFNSLQRAEECGLKSVALPAISSGLFGYPLPECADSIVRSVRSFCERPQSTPLKEILLVNNDDKTVAAMEKACRRIFSVGTASSPAVTKAATSDHNSTHAVQLGNVRLTLKRGKIEEEKTHVIVNTAGKDCQNNGEIFKAIQKKAGPKMAEEMKRINVADKTVITTQSYKLHCKEVYHILWNNKSTNPDQAFQLLQNLPSAILKCLQIAVEHSHKSISFPAIGTGGLGFEKNEVAQIMLDAVLEFAKKYSQQMEVYFVIYPSEDSTFKAFEDKMRYLQQKAFNPQLSKAEQQDDFSGSGASTPKIYLSGANEESLLEARLWLSDILFNSCIDRIIKNNFITHFGEEEDLQLTNIMTKNNVSTERFLKKGQASIVLSGNIVNVAVAFLEVENILCKVQREFIEEEKKMFLLYKTENLHYQRSVVSRHNTHFTVSDFLAAGLEVVKVEKVENHTLSSIFDLKKQQLGSSGTQKMLQWIPAHFCDMVSRIGFQAEFAPPNEPAQGQGIYFTSKVPKAMKMWNHTNSEYLYFVEAEVLTGNSVPGTPDLILPPSPGADPLVRYDSVTGGHDICVIFTGYQALPVHIITCKNCTYNLHPSEV